MAAQPTFPNLEAPEPPAPGQRRIAALRARRAEAKDRYDRAIRLADTQAQRRAWLALRDATNAALRGRA